MIFFNRPFTKITDDEQAELDRVDKLVRSLEPKLRDAFLSAVKQLQESIDMPLLEQYLRNGDVNAAMNLISQGQIANGLSPFLTMIGQAAMSSGAATVSTMRGDPLFSNLNVSFSVVNPGTAATISDYELTRIREMSQQQIDAINTAIRNGISNNRDPATIAQDIRGSIGLTSDQEQAVSNYRTLLETRDQRALQRALRDKRFDRTVANPQKPLSAEKIERMVQRYRERYLTYRANTIARTEAQTAVSQGNMAAWEQQIENGQMTEEEIKRGWIYTDDLKVRHAHRTIPGLNPSGVGFKQPFVSELGPIMYPGDPDASAGNRINCRCAQIIRYVPKMRAA